MPIPETERQRTERLLRDMLAEAQAAQNEAEESRRSLLSGLFSQTQEKLRTKSGTAFFRREPPPQQDWPQPPQVAFPKPAPKADRRSDLVVAALGVTLGLICALFPWYIFYNNIRFSTHGFYLGGNGDQSGRIVNPNPAAGEATPETAREELPRNLDLFATGTPAEDPEKPEEAPGLDQQPFPADTDFRLVHVANGRAMIEDDAGLWIVQPGSTLPDNTKLAAIQKRNGKWVLVTSANTVIELTP